MSSVFSPRTLNGLGGLGWKGPGKRTRPEAGNQDALAHLPSAGHAPHEAGHLPRPPAPSNTPPPLATAAAPGDRCPSLPAFPHPGADQDGTGHPLSDPRGFPPTPGGPTGRPPASRPLVPLPRACLSHAQLHPGHSVNTLHASCPATTPTATACGVWSTAVQADHPTRAQCRSASGPAARSAHQGPVAGGPRRR